MNGRWSATLVSLILCSGPVPAAVGADSPIRAAEQQTTSLEIAYLIQQVQLSDCRFYRNGTWYAGQSAQAHLRSKYEYLSARGQIHSAEDFIEKVASKSSVSGEAYQIQCVGLPPEPSSQWFRNLLAHYRESAH